MFHRSTSAQSAAIAEATGSDLTHVGVVFLENGRPTVFEATQPVKFTPYEEWVKRGNGTTYVRRLRDADDVITARVLESMREIASSWAGGDYDAQFSWTDDRLYCSELVWKLYDRAAGVHLGEPRPFGSYQLDGHAVRKAAATRFPHGVPEEELAVSPQDIFEHPGLIDVRQDDSNAK